MINFTYENQGSSTYLVYKVGEDDVIDTMSLGMITNNKIAGIAPTVFTQQDITKYFKYNVTAKITVKQFFSGPVNQKRLVGVFKAVTEAMMSVEEYMLDINSILLDLDCIFADVTTCETVLICLPIQSNVPKNTDLGRFFKDIMFTTQFDQTENCDYVAKIINYLNSAPVFSLESFRDLLNTISNTKASAPVPQVTKNVAAPPPVVSQPQPANNKVEAVKPEVSNVQNRANNVQNRANEVASVAKPVNQPTVNVPPVQPKVDNTAANAPASGKKMSMFNLLMHYNKENAAIYKAQKEAEKTSKQNNQAQPIAGTNMAVPKEDKNSKRITSQPKATVGFAVPGQAIPVVNNTTNTVVPQASPVNTAATHTNVTQTPVNSTPVQQPAYVPRQAPQGQSANFGETTVLGGAGIGETTVLSAMPNQGQAITPYLIRSKNNEKISVNKPVYRIGKERSYVDYFIGDNTAISRSHANIISREGEYFVVDTNSTNHTFVNGGMINSNEEIRITHGDKIRLANEDFEFKLY